MRLFIAVLAAAATSLVLLTSIASAGSDVRVTALDCESHPRRIRIENKGDAAQDLSGWQLQSDPVEGQPLDLGLIGSLKAGAKVFVFQGHLSPPTDPLAGFYRWGTDETFNLRANDSTDYVRIVDAQGNTVDQRNCEGLAPGATPAPTTEFDPPPLAPVVLETATATPAPTATATAAPARATATVRAAATVSPGATNAGIPASGGPPGADQRVAATVALAAGALVLAASILLVVVGLKRAKPGA